MSFKLPDYKIPDFNDDRFRDAPTARTVEVAKDGIAPLGYHALSIFPEYFKVAEQWLLTHESRMDCTAVIVHGDNGTTVEAVEARRLKKGDQVIVGRTEDGSEGIYVDTEAFTANRTKRDSFAFRGSRSRETAYSRDYDELYDLLRYERQHGYVVWVLGPAVAFDYDSRRSMAALVEKGYVQALLAGNALATHDLEGAVMKTALGQDIYTQESQPLGHYNHLDLLNLARGYSSLKEMVYGENIGDGIVNALVRKEVPFVLAGSIRDDGPLPGVIGNVYEAQDAMRKHVRKATTVIALATQLHTIATGNMTPSYTVREGRVRPVYIYSVDISEFAVNKLKDRGTLSSIPIVTNVQDFLVNLNNNL